VRVKHNSAPEEADVNKSSKISIIKDEKLKAQLKKRFTYKAVHIRHLEDIITSRS